MQNVAVADRRSGAGPGDPSCTVAILCSGRPSIITTLEALLPQLGKHDEVLLIRTCADARLPDFSELDQHVRIVPYVEDVFDFGRARNFAVREARGDILAFTDDDCIPEKDWLSKLRSGLKECDAVGGACLPERHYQYPWWWSHELDWAIGMSTPGFMRGQPEHYPAASNLAAFRAVYQRVPFQERPREHSGHDLYYSGREDAEWWRTVRVNGLRACSRPDIVVRHDIPQERIGFRYVLSRMRADGVAYWKRRASNDFAQYVTREYVNARANLACSLASFSAPRVVRSYLWLQRWRASHAEALQAGATSPCKLRDLQYHAVRKIAADLYYDACKVLRPRKAPPAQPKLLFISALTFLGDTVMLRPVIAALAAAIPNTRIHVVASYPELLTNMPTNVTVMPKSDDSSTRHAAQDADFALVPYYSKGDPSLWRNVLARKAATFDAEVGFDRPRDYSIAAQIVWKQHNKLHELDELRRLFGTIVEIPAVSLQPYDFAPGEPEARRHVQFIGQRDYLLLQTTSGWIEKDWPLDRWVQLAQKLSERYPCSLVFLTQKSRRGELEAGLKLPPERYRILDETHSISALGFLITKARLLICPCSGPKHLAFAQGTPTFTMYGPTQPEQWGALPANPYHRFIRALPSPITHEEAVGLSAGYFINQITVEQVFDGVCQFLDER
ncbi:MAG: glycosyltransferase family 9 protein [Candidatus Sumerlaeaceae bacterium]